MPRDRGKILFGLGLFVLLMAFPIWYNVARGKAGYRPEVVRPTAETKCVESREYMVAKHMNLLNDWRDWFVREGRERSDRTYKTGDGRVYKMSLTGTCLSARCHANKAEFCDRCHSYVSVNPYCFDCHLVPKTGASSAPQPGAEGRRVP